MKETATIDLCVYRLPGNEAVSKACCSKYVRTKMSAGSVAVPNIIPLQAPGADGTGRNCLRPDTKIELKSGTRRIEETP